MLGMWSEANELNYSATKVPLLDWGGGGGGGYGIWVIFKKFQYSRQ